MEVSADTTTWSFAVPLAVLRVTAVCQDHGVLPRHLGSALRGSLGHALRRAHALPGASGNGLYSSIFEPAPAPGSLLAGQRAVAPAFVFAVPLLEATPWYPGRLLQFRWTLIGPAAAHAEAMIHALDAALLAGLGLQLPRTRFAIASIDIENAAPGAPTILLDRAGGIPLQLDTLAASQRVATASCPAAGTLTLKMRSPLHLRARKTLIEQPSFRDLARAMLMRLEALAGFGVFRGRPDARALLATADQVETVAAAYRRVDYERFSQRQGRRIALNGILGHGEYCGPVGAFAGLLPLMEAVHLGHGTAWGMGGVTLRPAS